MPKPGIISLGESPEVDRCDEADYAELSAPSVASLAPREASGDDLRLLAHTAFPVHADDDELTKGLMPPQHEDQIGDVVVWVKQQVLTELSSINQKLEQLSADVHVRQTWLDSTCTDATKCLHQSKCLHQLPLGTSNVHKLRVKSKVIGAFVAAGKRNHPPPSNYASSNTSTPISSCAARSVAASVPTTRDGNIGRVLSRWEAKRTILSLWESASIAMWDSTTNDRLKKIHNTLNQDINRGGLRRQLWRFLSSPYSSNAAYIYAVTYQTMVLGSVFAAFLNMSSQKVAWDVMQMTFEALFALEFAMRLICCPQRCAFILSFFNLADVLSFLPLAFRLAMADNTVMFSDGQSALAALVPLLRLLKLLRCFEKLQLLLHAFELAFEALPALLYTMALLTMFFSELVYFVEPHQSIPDLPTAVWFTIVTMTTVGYGEITPKSTAGHFVSSALIIVSVMFMAIPIGIVGNAFSEVWSDRDHLLVMKRFRDAFLEGGLTMEGFRDIFSIFDEDGSGHLDVGEFGMMLKTIRMNISEERVHMLYEALDVHGEGHITFEALVDGLVPKAFAQEFFTQGMTSVKLNPLNVMQTISLKAQRKSKGDVQAACKDSDYYERSRTADLSCA
jgi:voltage-gated potassium channel